MTACGHSAVVRLVVSVLLLLSLSPLCSSSCLEAWEGASPALLQSLGCATNSTTAAFQRFLRHAAAAAAVSGAAPREELHFRLVTDEAPWEGRGAANALLLNRPLSFLEIGKRTRTLYPGPTFVLTNGYCPDSKEWSANSVWLSSDHGRTWVLAAGITANGEESASPDTSYTPTLTPYTPIIADSAGQSLWGVFDVAWMSTDAVRWRDQTGSSRAPPPPSQYYPSLFLTAEKHIIVAGGLDLQTEEHTNVVWRSEDSGRTWQKLVERAEFTPRRTAIGVQGVSTFDGRELTVMYLITGFSGLDELNDVWASSDGGEHWSAIGMRAPFPQRRAGTGAITKNGVLILAGGTTDDQPGEKVEPYRAIENDVWASMDGGYTCHMQAPAPYSHTPNRSPRSP